MNFGLIMVQNNKTLQLSKIINNISDDTVVTGVTCDSRRIEKGFLFAAFKGLSVDGHDYIDAAVKKGAAVVLYDANETIQEKPGILYIKDDNPRKLFSKIVAAYFEVQPETVAAVTGTNGKTSVAHFCRQLWHYIGFESASMGTTGITDSRGKFAFERSNFLTTPDPVKMHRIFAKLSESGITHLALEASSHGLDQYRLDAVKLRAAAFTNLSRDHLDYHGSLEAYFDAKMRLFEEVLPEKSVAVINADIPEFNAVVERCEKRGHRIISFGEEGKDIVLKECKQNGMGQQVVIEIDGKRHALEISLVGDFQVSNLLCAMGLVMATGANMNKVLNVLEKVQSVPGRMEKVFVEKKHDVGVFVDFAHTPDALEKALHVLKPYTKGKLWCVFGCGGDRDKGKRPQMGKIACQLADKVVVTDDNPRSEDPVDIRGEILAACEGAREIGNREKAIQYCVEHLAPGDVLLIAGKGHEKTQIVGDEVLPFDDVVVAKNALLGDV